MPALLQYMRFSVPHPSPKHVPKTILWPSYASMKYTHCLSNAFQPSYYELAIKKMSHSYLYLDSSRLHHVDALHMSSDVRDIQCFCNWHESKVGIGSSERQTCNEEAQADIFNESLNNLCDKDQKEMERRRKIGLANKGRVPWNKGRKHTAETRVRIKQRTIEALRDPKVRKKMAEHQLAHSDKTKARIGSALKHVWAKRLRWKWLGEEFLLPWSKSIAKAAKDGGSDQQELDWDSYDKIKQELDVQQLQWAAEKAKVKEMAKIMAEQAALGRAEKAAQKKAEKMARLAEKRKEWEEKAKARRERKRKEDRKKEKNKEFSVSQGLKLKRLIKIHKKRSVNVPVSIRGNIVDSHARAWEKFDVNLIKKEKMQREVPLADQIQAAKIKRAETIAKEVLAASSSNHPQSVKRGSDSQLQFMRHK